MTIYEPLLLVNPLSSQALLIKELDKYNIEYGTLISPSMANHISKSFKNIMFTSSDDYLTDEELNNISKYKTVFYGSDNSTKLADKIALNIRAKFSNDFDRSLIRQHKFYLHEHLNKINSEYGINQQVISSFDLITKKDDYLSNFNFPIVVKPMVNSGGSFGISVCKDKSSLENHINIDNKDYFGNRIQNYFIQDFIEGDEYIVDTVSLDSKHVITCISKHNKIIIDGNIIGLANDTWLDPIKDNTIWEKVRDMITNVLDETGYKNGFADTEFIITKSGKIKVIEVNFRNTGSHGLVSKISDYSYGRNHISALSDLLHGKDINQIPSFKGFSTFIRIQNLSSDNKIFYNSMLDFAKSLTTFKEIITWAEDGSLWKSAVKDFNIFVSPAAIVLFSDILNDLIKDKEYIFKVIKNNFDFTN